VHRNVGIVWRGGDSKGVPLISRDIGNLDEEPLTGDIFEAWFYDAQLHCATRMDEDLREPGGLPCPDFPPHSFTKVKDSGPDDKPPAEVSKTMLRRVEGEGRNIIGIDAVSDKTASGMRVKGDHEEKCEVVSIPKCLEALAADLVVSGGVHYEHYEQHEMASDATSLCVVNILGALLTDLSFLNVDEVDVMGSCMDHGPEGHRIGDLPMEPDVLIGREEPTQFRTDEANDVAQHRDEDQAPIEGEGKTGATRSPDRPLKGVEAGKSGIGCLRVPTICEEEEMQAVEDDVEGKSLWGEELSLKPRFLSHLSLNQKF